MIFIYMLYGFMAIMLLFLLIGCIIVIVRHVCTPEVSLPTPQAPPSSPPKKVPEMITVVVHPDGQDYALGRPHQVDG